jgi:outer membrane protein OmpA-like peptidoglycan-associated protein
MYITSIISSSKYYPMIKKVQLLTVIFCAVILHTISVAQDSSVNEGAVPSLNTANAPALNLFGTGTDPDPSMGAYKGPKDMWEFGINVGHAFVSGDVDFNPGFGGGLSLRKSLDHVFSLRGDANYLLVSGEQDRSIPFNYKGYSTTWMGGQIVGLMSLNNFSASTVLHKVSPYALFGAGLNYFSSQIDSSGTKVDPVTSSGETALQPHAVVGAGIALRLSNKLNIALEHQATVVLGRRADFLDQIAPHPFSTTYRDILQYTSLRLNFNLGNASTLSEPLWWVNPIALMNSSIEELQARPKYDPTDTDGDGVIDMIDQEKESPAGAQVDTRGVTLDSDGDKVPDYKDDEPFSAPGYQVDAKGVAQVPKPDFATQPWVKDYVDGKLKDFAPKGGGMADWFLPMIHFDLDKYGIKRTEYEHLYQVASVMKSNPSLKVVVTGYTDKSATDTYNNVLSYNRANAAVNHLVGLGISRDRLLINHNGENNNLVPSNGANYMNRRVEFRVATATDKEMSRPEGPNAGTPGVSGNKSDGY